MATKVQRAKTVLDALADRDLGNQTLLKVKDAFVHTFNRGATLTNEQGAAVIIAALRQYIRQIVEDAEVSQAADTAIRNARPGAQVDLGED